jgi:hypothetical protein
VEILCHIFTYDLTNGPSHAIIVCNFYACAFFQCGGDTSRHVASRMRNAIEIQSMGLMAFQISNQRCFVYWINSCQRS